MTTTCNRCNKPLTDPVSVERGIGHECWAKFLKKGGHYFAHGIQIDFRYLGAKTYTEAKDRLMEAAHT